MIQKSRRQRSAITFHKRHLIDIELNSQEDQKSRETYPKSHFIANKHNIFKKNWIIASKEDET